MTNTCGHLRRHGFSFPDGSILRVAFAVAIIGLMGCAAMRPLKGVPASHLPDDYRFPYRSVKSMIDLSLLRQTPPQSHRVDAGDVLGIYVEGILGGRREAPPINIRQNANGRSSLGYPIRVREDGTISLPMTEPILVKGMTIGEVEKAIRRAYTTGKKPVLVPGNERILVDLQRPRHYEILVIRQEAALRNSVSGAVGRINISSSTDKRGTGRIVSLPAYQNDVLHALAETGGLPGLDAENTIYVIRGKPRTESGEPGASATGERNAESRRTGTIIRGQSPDEYPLQSLGGYSITDSSSLLPRLSSLVSRPSSFLSSSAVQSWPVIPWQVREIDHRTIGETNVVRIPLRVTPGERPAFTEEDIILRDGDVVLIESRETDVFFTGGLLGGGRYILPRDYDLDVLQALALVQSQANRTLSTRAVGGIAATNQDVTVGASELIVLRRLADGGQVAIRVDLYRAMRDPAERIMVLPGDHLMLQYTRTEACVAFFERHILEGLVFGGSSGFFFSN